MTKFLAAPGLALLLLASGPAATTPTTETHPVDDVRAVVEAALNQFEVKAMAPGPAEPGWSEAGTDLHALVDSRPGGRAANFLLQEDKDGSRSVMILSPSSPLGLVPDTWSPIADIGDIESAASGTDFYIGHLEGPYYAVLRGSSRQVGKAYCSSGPVTARLYRRPEPADADELAPEIMELLFGAVVRRLEKYEVCTRYDADGDGYRSRSFLPDGRSLPGLEESEERVTVVPAAPVETLLGS